MTKHVGLRLDGILPIIGMDPHGQRDRSYVYDYFEGTYELDLHRFPPVAQTVAWMKEAGFADLKH